MTNDLLYRLMDYQRDKQKWYDEEDIEQRWWWNWERLWLGMPDPFDWYIQTKTGLSEFL